jgi:NAD kinase
VFGAADEQLIDYAVSIGGDGTLLYLMSKFQHRSSPPVFIFSKGTLGFLCIYSVDSLEKVLGDLADLLAQGKTPHTK